MLRSRALGKDSDLINVLILRRIHKCMALLVKLEDEAPLQERGRLGGPAEGMSFLTSSTSELQDDQLFSSMSSSAVMPLPGHRARSPGAGQWWTETSYLKLNSLLPKFTSGNFPSDEMLTQTSPSIRRHELIAQGLAMWFGKNTPVMQNCLYLLNGGEEAGNHSIDLTEEKKNEIMYLSANWDCTWPRV